DDKIAWYENPTDNAALVNYSNGSTTTKLTFDYTVVAGENSSDLDYISTGALTLNGGTIIDAVGNTATLTLPFTGTANSLAGNEALIIDTEAPTLPAANIVVNNSVEPNTITLTFSESLTQAQAETASNYGVTNVDGDPYTIASASLSGAVVTLTLAAVSAADDGTFITNTDVDAGINVTPHVNITDITGNAYAGGPITESGATHTKEQVIPTVLSVSSTTADGTYNKGDQIDIIVTFDEVVFVNEDNGTPQLNLETGLGGRYPSDAAVSYASGHGSTILIFSYIVESGHSSDDLDYTDVTALALNNGTIRDIYDND
ncbi:uncharacterized protein METZ01_LOCUS355211, partial [marine metagenome]